MRLSVLILVAGTIGLTFFACAPTAPVVVGAPAPPPPQVGGVNAQGTPVCNAGALNPVPFAVQSFDPMSNQIPTADAAIQVNPDVQDDLAAAFNAAPAFQSKLCQLSGIFIDTRDCTRPAIGSTYDPNLCVLTDQQIAGNSWGLRVYDSQGNNLGTYIGLSLGLWKNDPSTPWSCQPPHQGQVCAPPFQNYQTRLIRALFQTIAANVPSSYLPYFSKIPASTNTAAMSVLAALAHEFGHVYWWDSFVPNPGGDAVPKHFCNGNFYYKSWYLPVAVPQGRWITFGQLANNNYHLPDDVNMMQLQQYLARSDYADAGDLIHGLYSGSLPHGQKKVTERWASALAAFSPDEDLVETLELQVLMNANPPLQSMPVTINGTTVYIDDVPKNLYSKPEVLRKMSCIGPLPG